MRDSSLSRQNVKPSGMELRPKRRLRLDQASGHRAFYEILVHVSAADCDERVPVTAQVALAIAATG